ncbi:SDR family oxidoreductase [Marinihelvus fidelis]|uniref:SDR family oxidoreductase n=1 Tax=Marinihelvus fidelis TaxID=2613842 RepID=A0A5N0TCK5_9GAMM|nr:SDR family oxidoreductase [Marinihelvus fidelis]KAA9132700.1 SDR family oxidoreductase [Marinihelvus fidelis]
MANVLISGANRGIGLALARLYHDRGDRVVALCRSNPGGLDGLGVEVHENCDVTDQAALDRLAKSLQGQTIDVLVANAGIMIYEGLDELDREHCLRQYEVNALGPVWLTRALLPNLVAGSKVGIVSSRVGSLADNQSGGNYGYRMSKAAVNMAGVNLAHDLAPRGVAVALLHPGYVKTDMVSMGGDVEPDVAAAGLVERLDELDNDSTGTFWHAQGQALPW